MNSNMHIFFASDNNFVLPLTNAISSILRNASEEDYHNFYILDKNISLKNKKRINNLKKIKDFSIEYIKIEDSLFVDCPLTKECSHISLQTYYRYIIPRLKPELEKILYLDCDILVVDSLKELWNVELGDSYCAVVEELYKGTSQEAERLNIESYFNAGVLLINNAKWVKENITECLFNATRELYVNKNLIWQDQDVLNYVFKDNVKWISPKFNYQQNCYPNYTYTRYTKTDIDEAESNTGIIHYNTRIKPWDKGYKSNFRIKEYYREMFKNKFFLELFKLALKSISHFCISVNKEKDYGYVKKTTTILGFKIKTRSIETLFLSMGRGCHTAMMLEKMGYRKCSYPMDWIIPENSASSEESMKKRFEFLMNGFVDFFNKEDLIFYPEISNGKHIKCINKATNFVFSHDFLNGKDSKNQYILLMNKYSRRISRLMNHIKSVKKVNLIYIENTWDHFNEAEKEIDSALLNRLVINLKEKYPSKEIKFYYFIHDNNYSINTYKKEVYSENVIKFFSNHKYTLNDESLGMILGIEKSFNKEFGGKNA